MATESSGFFSDPKVILSLLAILISLAGLLWSLANQFEQNRRWDALNMGYIELTKPAFSVFRTVSRKEFKNLNVGYESKAYGSDSSIDEVRFVHLVRVRDAKTGALIPNLDPTITLAEVEHELAKLPQRPKEVVLTRVYRPIFFFKNSGKTDVREFSFNISHGGGNSDVEWIPFLKSGSKATVLPGQEFNITNDVEVPLSARLPEKLPFRIEIEYKDIGGRIRKEIIRRDWYSETNSWKYE